VGWSAVDSEKIVAFLVFFFAFLWVTRRLFSREKPPGPSDFQPPVFADPPEDYAASGRGKPPATIGAELPFPVALPPVQQLPSGRYNRPKVLNYYFSNLDLKTGPDNPRVFCDQLFVQFEAPETGATWTSEYTVASPFGLQELMDGTGQNLTFDGTIVIVPRWDMALILRTVLEDVIDKYAHAEPDNDATEDSTRRYQG
jgi:hypothetical protein